MFLNAPRKEIHLFFLITFFQICGLIGVLFIDRDLTLSLTPQNLLVTTFSIFFIYEDKIKMLRFFIFAFSIGFLVEVIGVNYGIIFGNYAYGKVLGFKVLNVPLMIGVNWFFLSIACGGISDMIFNKLLTRIFFASLTFLSISIFSSKSTSAQEKTFRVDAEKSTLKWNGYHLMKSYKHYGGIKIKEGSLTYENGKILGGKFVLDATSIDVDDLAGVKQTTLAKHLHSKDFFDVKNHPEVGLEITNSFEQEDGSLYVLANLSIKGITKRISFKTSIEESTTGNTIIAKAIIRFDRSKFNVDWGSSNLAKYIVDDNVDIETKIVGRIK